MTSPSDNVIVHYECPKCGRVGRAGPGHAPSYSAESERNPAPCDGQSVDRVYVAVDALLSDEAIRAAGEMLLRDQNLPMLVNRGYFKTVALRACRTAVDAVTGAGE